MADTTIRLWHIGNHAYGWEDAGMDRRRFDTFVLNFGSAQRQGGVAGKDAERALADLAMQFRWPPEKPEVPPSAQPDDLPPDLQDLLVNSLPETTRLIVETRSDAGSRTRHLAALARNAAVLAIDQWQESSNVSSAQGPAQAGPKRFDAFLSECWPFRSQITPLRTEPVDGFRRIASVGLQPDLIYLDGSGRFESILDELRTAIDLFPRAIIVGDGWNLEGVRKAVETAAKDRAIRYAGNECGWRMLR